MRIQIMSDLHLEFHADRGKSFIDSLDFDGTDVLVLAGDISNAHGIVFALEQFSRKFKKRILFVAGNHEYYGSSKKDVDRAISNCIARGPTGRVSHAEFLNRDFVHHDHEPRFVGTTMWFKDLKGPDWAMNDFVQIEDFRGWVYDENRKDESFLEKNIYEGDIVITHYLPSYDCVDSKYKDSNLNCFFVNEMSHVIKKQKPKLWIHGHTHESVDMNIGDTRIICNPFGYLAREENPRFNQKLIVEV